MIFLKKFFSNFRSHIKDSKWGRKCIFINCTSCNGSPQQIPFQFANGKLPYSRYRAFWAGLSVTGHSKIISDLGGPKTSMALASGGIIFFFSHSLMRAQSITDLISQIEH